MPIKSSAAALRAGKYARPSRAIFGHVAQKNYAQKISFCLCKITVYIYERKRYNIYIE